MGITMSKKIIMLVGSFWIICMPVSLISAESGEYRKATLEFRKLLDRELKKNHDYIPSFYSQSGGGIYLTKYDVQTTSYLSDIIRLTIKEYEKHNKKITITIAIYSQTYKEVVGYKGLFIKPIMKFRLEGERQ